MDSLQIKGTNHHPEVNFNAETRVLSLNGRSLPEQVLSLYQPILKWVEEFTQNSSSEETVFHINLDYINSSSSKYLLEILKRLNDFHNSGNTVRVEWLYDEFDEDAEESGEEYKDLLDLEFVLIKK